MNEEELRPPSARGRELRVLALSACWVVAGVGLAAFADGAVLAGVGPETALVATPGAPAISAGYVGSLAFVAAVATALLAGAGTARAAE